MGKPITGVVSFPKEIVSDDFWLSEPFDRPRALADLWLLANDRQRTFSIRGQPVTCERGQLARSVVQLSERWRWSRPKTAAFLVALQDERRIMFRTTNLTTIITVIDYTVYNDDSTPETAPELTPELTPDQPTEMTADFTQKVEDRSTEDRRGKRATPHFPEIDVPSLDEFKTACNIRGIPDFFAEAEYAWRAERPADRWPRGTNWQTAVTTTFNRWRDKGSPAEIVHQNGAAKKSGGAWAMQKQIEALRLQLQNHPANPESAAYDGDPTETQLTEFEEIQKKLAEAGKAMAGQT